MPNKKPNYYFEKAGFLGWDEKDATLDKERIRLLDKFIAGKKVLDVGCGTGIYVDYLSKKGFDAWGLDFVEEFISRAKKSKKGSFFIGKAEKLPFKDLEFDTVILFNTLEHGPDKLILKEAKRVAKRQILVIVPKIVDEELAKSGVIFRHYLDKSHLKEYAREDFEHLAKSTGLSLSFFEQVHPLYNETIFLALFGGSILLRKIIRKLVFAILPKRVYPTEYFAVFSKR